MLFMKYNVIFLLSIFFFCSLFVYLNTIHCVPYTPRVGQISWRFGSRKINFHDRPHVRSSGSDDTYLLSPGLDDISVIGRPYSSIFPRTAGSSEPASRNLVLRSSSDKIMSVDGLTVYAFLINRDELLSLLEDSASDLRSQSPNALTSYYQHNATKWSFSVVAPNDCIRYTAIEAVVNRYIKLAHATTIATPSDITWARAGALYRANIPTVGIFITPSATTVSTKDSLCPITNTTTYQKMSNIELTEVYTVTPGGSTCSYQVVDQSAALNPFSNTNHPKRNGFDAQVFAHAAQTIFSVSVRLWRDPQGIPMRINRLAAVAVLAIALNSLFPDELKKNFTMETRFFSQIDSGVHDLGHMKVRFLMQISPPDARSHLLALPPSAWRELIALLRDPLQAMQDHYYAWAIGGEIFKNGTVIGKWNLHALCY